MTGRKRSEEVEDVLFCERCSIVVQHQHKERRADDALLPLSNMRARREAWAKLYCSSAPTQGENCRRCSIDDQHQNKEETCRRCSTVAHLQNKERNVGDALQLLNTSTITRRKDDDGSAEVQHSNTNEERSVGDSLLSFNPKTGRKALTTL